MFTQSMIFFFLSGGILILCAVMFSVADKNEFFNHYTNLKNAGSDDEERDALLENGNKKGGMTIGELGQQFKINMAQAWPMILSIWGVFTITFVVFPGAFFDSKFYFLDKIGVNQTEDDETAWY